MVIGLDGLSLDLLQCLVDRDELPTFAALLQNGAYGTLSPI